MGLKLLTFQKVCFQTRRNSSGQQRLACARGAVEQYALRRLDTDSEEKLGVLERKFDDFSQFSDLVIQASDTAKADLSRVLQGHVVHKGIDLAGKHSHNRKRRHIERNTRALLKFGFVDL